MGTSTGLVSLVLALLPISFLEPFSTATAGICDDSSERGVPQYVALECRISAPEDGVCYREISQDGGGVINTCSNDRPCMAWTGIQLKITCLGEDDPASTYRLYSTQGEGNFSWPFATSAAVEGVYTCRRRDNGTFVSNRSVEVNEKVYVIPAGEKSYSHRRVCQEDIAPDFDCNLANRARYYQLDQAVRHSVGFNVLGARPIDLKVEVLWMDHYPVDLHLSYINDASNSTTLHSVKLSIDDLVLVGRGLVEIYLVITANSRNYKGSSTMCIPVTIFGEPTLFANESLPEDVTVVEGSPADFHCQFHTTITTFTDTVALLVRPPGSGDLVECLNCTFTTSALVGCIRAVDKDSCDEITFSNVISGHSLLVIHHLAARWAQVGAWHSGSEVVCAIAVRGVTQWRRTATLTVLEADQTERNAENEDQAFATRDVVLLLVGAVAAVILLEILLAGGLLLLHFRRGKLQISSIGGRKWLPAPTEDDTEMILK